MFFNVARPTPFSFTTAKWPSSSTPEKTATATWPRPSARGGIERLDLLIITHFDKDHVGGADKILENIEVARVLEPDYDKDSKQYRQYCEALEEQGVAAEALCETRPSPLGGCEFSIDVANRGRLR